MWLNFVWSGKRGASDKRLSLHFPFDRGPFLRFIKFLPRNIFKVFFFFFNKKCLRYIEFCFGRTQCVLATFGSSSCLAFPLCVVTVVFLHSLACRQRTCQLWLMYAFFLPTHLSFVGNWKINYVDIDDILLLLTLKS